MIENHFPETLRALMRSRKDVKEIARTSTVTRAMLYQYSIQHAQPKLYALIEIANFFNVSLDYLVTGKGSSPSDSTSQITMSFPLMQDRSSEKSDSEKKLNAIKQGLQELVSKL